MRIAHLTTSDISLALLLAKELEIDLGHGHTVFGISAPGAYVSRVEDMGVRHVPVKQLTRAWHPLGDATAFLALVRTIRGLRLDVLHTHNPKTGLLGRIAGRIAGVPVVVNTCHGLWAQPTDHWSKRALVYGLEALAARFSDYEFFQNEADQRTMLWALKEGRHSVVGNGIDLERFRRDDALRRSQRASWGVGEDEMVVGTVGRQVAEKGLAEFERLAVDLRGQAAFVWVGPADSANSSLVPSSDAVRYVGEIVDMPAAYSAFDIFVLASHREGFSRASMEAAACGVPMVLANIRGCREIGAHGEHLLLVNARQPAAFAEAVKHLLGNATARKSLGSAARERARTHFDQREVARHSLTVYEECRRRPSWRRGWSTRAANGEGTIDV